MVSHAKQVRQALFQAIHSVVQDKEKWLQNPRKDFTRHRKLNFEQVLLCLIGMEGKSLSSELLEHFDFKLETPTVSALCQARDKISAQAFQAIFERFQPAKQSLKLFHGFRLLAHDGSDIKLPLNPEDQATYIEHGKQSCNLTHLNALYDLINRQFVAASIEDKHNYDERQSLIDMAQSLEKPAIIIADRGYRSLNLYEHLRKSGHYFVIRESDTAVRASLLNSLALPRNRSFDQLVHFKLSRRQTKAVKENKNIRFLSSSSKFDHLPPKEKASYPMTLRVVRFKIGKESYESLVTNLPSTGFSTAALKQLYHLRWGIETAFRELKYALGMSSFHAKKKSLIKQEIFARLIMYNFAMRIAMQVKPKQASRKHSYQINFTHAFGLCREYFRHPKHKVEPLIQRLILPIRPGRADPRKIKVKPFVGFCYRVA